MKLQKGKFYRLDNQVVEYVGTQNPSVDYRHLFQDASDLCRVLDTTFHHEAKKLESLQEVIDQNEINALLTRRAEFMQAKGEWCERFGCE